MLMIKLVDARKGLHEKCVELFHNEKVAESIYMYLCDGLEECDVVEPERKKGEWKHDADGLVWCDTCGFGKERSDDRLYLYCPNCGRLCYDGRR